jgi:transposase-like protein
MHPMRYRSVVLKQFLRHNQIWFVDKTYIHVKGRWCYLYRGIDEDGNLVDVRLSEKRDMAAAKAFFAQAHEVAEQLQKW